MIILSAPDNSWQLTAELTLKILLEAELFGYRRGAFTGASCDRKGKLALAHNALCFLMK